MSQPRYPVLDGLRGLAIVLVLLFHFSYPVAPDRSLLSLLTYVTLNVGWSGVDLFFVLSGFLITGILVDTRDDEHYYRNFYGRRVLRIFPVYFLFLAGFVCAIVPATAGGFAAVRRDLPWLATFSINLPIAFVGTPPFALFFTATMWSLAVEEQFYACWPWFARWSGSRLRAHCLYVAIVAVLLRLGLAVTPWRMGAQFLVWTRMDTLAVGAWLALVLREEGRPRLRAFASWALPATGASLVAAWMLLALDRQSLFVRTIGFSIVGLFYAGVVASALSADDGGWARLGRVRWLQWFGKYSYGIYVWHCAVRYLLQLLDLNAAAFVARGWPWLTATALYMALGTGLSAAIAVASWDLIEAPANRLKRHFQYNAPARQPADAVLQPL